MLTAGSTLVLLAIILTAPHVKWKVAAPWATLATVVGLVLMAMDLYVRFRT